MERAVCLSPSTFVFNSSSEVLFYNSDSGLAVKYLLTDSVKTFISQVLNPGNMYAVAEREIKKDESSMALLETLASQFMIDYIEFDNVKPFTIPPFLKCHQQIWEKKYPGSKTSIPLTDLYVYLNGDCDKNCRDCKKYAFQMTHCTMHKGEISLNVIEQILNEVLSYKQPVTIHLCGGDIGRYTSLDDLSALLDKMRIRPQVHLSYLNWNPSLCKKLQRCNPKYVFSVEFPLDRNHLHEVSEKCRGSDDLVEFVVTSEDNIDTVDRMTKMYKLYNVDIIPFYNGGNLDFFKQNVFMGEDDIVISKPSKQMIFRRMIFNVNNVGKIILRSDGIYYANLNKSSLGNTNQKLVAIIEKEWEMGESWRDIRQTEPCSSCIFHYLCPSRSNYEYVLKRNLCFITNNHEKL